MQEEDPIEDIEDSTPDGETILISQELTAQLIKALQLLPENRREMVVLRYVLGWRVNQIAGYLSVPENTISVSIHRSLRQLQDSLRLQGVSNERRE
jgi:RNA polymerase sigma-70 factor (ECF subfamily)